MKKVILISMMLGLMAAPALAESTVAVSRTAGTYTSPGGEWSLTPNLDLMGLTAETGPYQSFYLEFTEGLNEGHSGTIYDVVVNDKAINGGVGPAGDPLDPRTAYLYTQFRAGTLSSYDYIPGAGRAKSAWDLSMAIWYIEDELKFAPPSPPGWNLSGNPQSQLWVNEATAAGWTDTGSVRVLNLYAAGHLGDLEYCRSDMLVVVDVPEPATLLLLGLGVVIVAKRR